MRSSREVAEEMESANFGVVRPDFRLSESTRFIEAYRREIIQEVRDGVQRVCRKSDHGCLPTCNSCQAIKNVANWVLGLDILQLDDPIDPRAVAAAEEWQAFVNQGSTGKLQAPLLAKFIDRHFKEKP